MTVLDTTSTTEGAMSTLKRGFLLSPEFRAGLAGTIALALVSTAGRVVVPSPSSRRSTGPRRPGGPDIAFIRTAVLVCAGAVLVTAVCAYLMNVRLHKTSEAASRGCG